MTANASPAGGSQGTWNPTREEILTGAQMERHELIAAENARHVNNLEAELRRYQAALDHIENVFLLRTSQPEAATPASS